MGNENFLPAFAARTTIHASNRTRNPMDLLAEASKDYRREKETMAAEARQRAAFFLTCGVDLPEALSAPQAERNRMMVRLQRLVERERIKGMRRHWSYDLNRHIALKQALDRLNGPEQTPVPPRKAGRTKHPEKQNGASRRRRR
jgi:hypothetical protein